MDSGHNHHPLILGLGVLCNKITMKRTHIHHFSRTPRPRPMRTGRKHILIGVLIHMIASIEITLIGMVILTHITVNEPEGVKGLHEEPCSVFGCLCYQYK
jgi:hypothetical protein